MPQTRNHRKGRSCKDLTKSVVVQISIDFPRKKKSSNTKKPPKLCADQDKEDLPILHEQGNLKSLEDNREEITDSFTALLTPSRKRRPKRTDENHSPLKKSPRNESDQCKSLNSSRNESAQCKSPLRSPLKYAGHCKSPLRSPLKYVVYSKSPLADRTNAPRTNTNLEEKNARRKLTLDSLPDPGYTKLRQVLHNSIPKKLISREKEIKEIKEFVQASVLTTKPGSLYICGAPGTGKTACLTKVLDECKGPAKFQTVFLNCMSLRYSQTIFSRIANLLDKSGNTYSNQDGLKYCQKKFTAAGSKILLVLDEIDQLESKNQEILYKLFEMPFVPRSRLALIGIANSLDFTDRILPRLQTRPSCKPILLQFQPYKKDEICAILQGRIQEINSDIVTQSAIQFCARKVSAMTGDARKALDMLRRAVEIAEGQSTKSPSPKKKDSELSKVTISHVATVCSEVYSAQLSTSGSTKLVFPLQQKIIVCTLVACVKDTKVKEVVVPKLYASYCSVCKSRHISPISQEEFMGICCLLESQGIVLVKKTKDLRSDKIRLRMQESELEHILQDKTLMSSILANGIRS